MVSNLAVSQTWTWTGNTSNDWAEGSNWSQGSEPLSTSTVSIPGTLPDEKPWPVLSGDAVAGTLTLNPDSRLDVNGHKITISGAVSITGAIVSNSGAGAVRIEAGTVNSGTSVIRNSTFTAALDFKTVNAALLNEADLTGANTYDGDVKFMIAATGTHNISNNFRSLFKGNLTIERTAVGTTNVLTSNTASSIAVKGNFTYKNHAGGNTTIGGTDNKAILEGEVNVDVETTGSNPSFTLRRLDNSSGVGGGTLSVKNPGSVTVLNDTLKVESFMVTGKWGANSGVTSDFDHNILTVGSGGFSYADAAPAGETAGNSGVLYFSRSTVNGTASFISNGTAAFYDGWSGRGPNTFNGDVSFTANGSGALYLSYYFKSKFNGNLAVSRTYAGTTDIFIAAGSNSIAGDFSFTNPAGGPTRIGGGSGGTTIGGKVSIEAGNPGSNNVFTLNRLNNADGDDGGAISIDRPSSLEVIGNTLKVQSFAVTGKRGGNSGVTSDFDQNTLTVGAGGFSYADAGAEGETAENSGPLYFSRSTVNGTASFISNGSALFYEGWSGQGENTFNGDVSFTANGSGGLYLSYYFKSTFNGNLAVSRTYAGTTDIFIAAGSNSIAGDFSFTNPAGGPTRIGVGSGGTTIGGKVSIEAGNPGSNNVFTLNRLNNADGDDGGAISIGRPSSLEVIGNTLKVQSFMVTGKWGANSGVASDFDHNILTVGAGGFSYADAGAEGETAANSGPLYFSRSTVNGMASFISNGSAEFYDGWSGRGANTFNGDASFTANGSGALYLSYYFKSTFNGNLAVSRTYAGTTDIFIAAGSNSIAGDFSFTNPAGGPTRIGVGSGGTTIGGKVSIEAVNPGSNNVFTLNRLNNADGDDGGAISIDRPSSLEVYGNTLKVQSFMVTGKWSANSGVASDFDQNTLTVGAGGFSYADAGAEGETAANSGPLYFSRSTVNGTASFISNGSAAFYEGWSGRGPNQFNGNVTFSRNGTGTVSIGQYYTSSYAADLWFASATGINVGSNRIRFNGGTNSTFSHTGVSESTLPGFILEKTGHAELILGVPAHITNSVTFITGYVRASESNPLVFRSGSGHSGAGDDSHVAGPVHKRGTTAFTFPVGNGATYHPVSISAPGGAEHIFSAEYKAADPDNYNPGSFEAPLEKVSDDGYWDVQRLSGGNGVYLTLTYNVPPGFITEPGDLRVAHWSGLSWESVNSTADETNTNTEGRVTTENPVTSFSPFALATTNSESNPLPVKLAEFLAVKENRAVQLQWMTTEEVNSDYFELEHSSDARSWKAIVRLSAKGAESSSARYTYTDASPFPGNNYYRLRMTDLDGSFAYSDIRVVDIGASSAGLAVYPNPAADHILVLPSSTFPVSSLELLDVSGRKVAGCPDGLNGKLDVRGLPPGLYFVKVTYSNNAVESRRLVVSR